MEVKKNFSITNIVKVIGWFLVFGISILALLKSCESNKIAHNSNDIASSSNQTANKALSVSQRPHLIVKPIKIGNTDKYFMAEVVNKEINLNFLLEITLNYETNQNSHNGVK